MSSPPASRRARKMRFQTFIPSWLPAFDKKEKTNVHAGGDSGMLP
jgi:hypothetical protein